MGIFIGNAKLSAWWLAAATVTAIVLPMALVLLVITGPAVRIAGTRMPGSPSVPAMSDIPYAYLVLYMSAMEGLPEPVVGGAGGDRQS